MVLTFITFYGLVLNIIVGFELLRLKRCDLSLGNISQSEYNIIHLWFLIGSVSSAYSRISQKYLESSISEVCFVFRQCNSFTFQSGQFADNRWENTKKSVRISDSCCW